MSRLSLPAVLSSIALLSAAPGAEAKEIAAMKVCGPDRCVHLKRTVAQRLHDAGALEGVPISDAVERATYYRVTIRADDGSGRHVGRFSLAYAPRPRAVLPLDVSPTPTWARLPEPAAARLARLTRGITPFPARRFPASTGAGALPARVYQPAGDADGGGVPGPLLAVVPVALVLAFGLDRLRRRA